MVYLSVKEFQKELQSLGFKVPTKTLYDYIKSGALKAQKEILRPARWAIPESELHRVVNID